MQDRKQRDGRSLASTIGRNTLFGVLSNVVQIGTRLVTVPFIIHHLGLGGYGIWNIIMMTAMYMRFGSVGVKTAFQKYVAEATGNGDYEKASRLVSTGCAVMFLISIAGLLPMVMFSRQIAVLSAIPSEFLTSAAGSISLLAVIMLMSNVGAVYEAIVMGGQRIDLARKYNTVFSILEAAAIVEILHLGYGLFAMAGVMGASEFLFVTACYFASRRVLPEIHVSTRFVTSSVLYELFRFAGTYQLVNVLEVIYGWLIPFIVLRTFGPTSAGLFAVVTRIVTSATSLQNAFLSPILSGGAMVYAAGIRERMQALITKAFKVTLALSLFPLGFICMFGPTLTYAWTGQSDPAFRSAFYLVCLRGLFGSFSILALVLYRISGKALLDNVRQLIRVMLIAVVGIYAARLGFDGVLAGLAFVELVGMIFMVYALTRTFHLFRAKSLLPDAARLSVASVFILGAGTIASLLPMPGVHDSRLSAVLRLAEICAACLAVTWPSLVGTGSITPAERSALFGAFVPQSRRGQFVEVET